MKDSRIIILLPKEFSSKKADYPSDIDAQRLWSKIKQELQNIKTTMEKPDDDKHKI